MKERQPKSINNRLTTWIVAIVLGSGLCNQAATTSFWILDNDGYWSDPGNWSPSEVPDGEGIKAAFNLPISSDRQVIANQSITLGGLEITSSVEVNANAYNFLTDFGILWTMNNAGQGAEIRVDRPGTFANRDNIYVPLELADNLITYSSGRYIYLLGPITESGGSRSIIHSGSGFLNLGTSTNSFSGGVIIKSGTLNSPGAGKLGPGNIIIGDTTGTAAAHLIGGTTSSSTSAHYTNKVIVAAGSSGAKTMRSSGADRNIMFAGPLELNDDVELTAANNTGWLNQAGPISGNGGIKASAQVGRETNSYVRLSANNTFSGGVILASGNLRLNGHNALGSGTLTIEDDTTLSSDGNSNRQPPNPVVVNGNFTLGFMDARGTIRLLGPVDIGPGDRQITLGSTVGHYVQGIISGTGSIILQDLNVRGLNLTAENTFSGGVRILNGNIAFAGTSAFGTGPLTLGDSTTVTNILVTGNGVVTNNITVVPGISGTRTLGCNGIAAYGGNISIDTDLIVGAASASMRTTILSGSISGPAGIRVIGTAPANRVIFSGANTYEGATTVAGGRFTLANPTGSATGNGEVTIEANAVLAGSGNIAGATTFEPGASLAPGDILVPGSDDLGWIAFDEGIVFGPGSTNCFDLSKAAGTNDAVAASSIQFGGALILTNISGSLAPGDKFKLFSSTGVNTGNFSEVLLLGSTLTGEFDPATGIFSIAGNPIADYPTNISFEITAQELSLNWPETHKGWVVQSNAMDIANGAAWHTVDGSEAGTTYSFPINPETPNVFYRLFRP